MPLRVVSGEDKSVPEASLGLLGHATFTTQTWVVQWVGELRLGSGKLQRSRTEPNR